MHPETLYDDLDWQILWENARKQKSWRRKGPKDWDKKAPSFAVRNRHSAFVNQVLRRIPVGPTSTILDAGAGPGTLALPLAPRVHSVTALDYSKGMLSILHNQARDRKINNITTVLGSWEDDWHDLDLHQHDICIASRSLNVPNLGAALSQLNYFAREAVYLVDRISPTPFDQDAFTALGRPFQSGPDYIFTLNTLYSMGIHPCVDIISLENTTSFPSLSAALESYRWMFHELSPDEERQLETYLTRHSHSDPLGGITLQTAGASRWALIWWRKDP